MGVWRQPVTVKMSDAERAELQRIHDALAPMHETLSQTIRWSLHMIHLVMFTPGMLTKFAAMLQGIQSRQVYDFPTHAAPEQPLPTAARTGRPVASGVGRPLRFSALSRQVPRAAGAGVLVQAYSTSCRDFRLLFAGGQA